MDDLTSTPDPAGMGKPGLDDDARDLLRQLASVMKYTHSAIAQQGSSAVLEAIEQHLGLPFDQAVIVEEIRATWEHASIDRGVAAWLEADPESGEWFGPWARHHQHNDLATALSMETEHPTTTLPRPRRTSVAIGPTESLSVIAAGFVPTHAPDGSPVILVVRQTQRFSPSEISVEVIATTPEIGDATLSRLRELIEAHDVLRGQVISFGVNEHQGNELVSFSPRPEVSAESVILPEGVLATIHDHVLGVGEHAEQLAHYGVHLKRGLLLHGPPGTGKTHTVRHLIGAVAPATVVVLAGDALRFIGQAAALARRLTPSRVVCDDVDLGALDRSYSPTGNPLLFSLLDTMDGVANDADVTFVLTTNRASDLEQALVQRPGRVDLAIEVPRPDKGGREQLLRLYAKQMPVTADLSQASALLEGSTASAMKEVMRRAALAALKRAGEAAADSGDAEVSIDDTLLTQVVDDYLTSTSALTRSLLGGAEADDVLAAASDLDGFDEGFGPQPGLYLG